MADQDGGSAATVSGSLSPSREALLEEHAADWMAGTPRPLQDYLERHPVPGGRRSLVLELVQQEVLLRQMQGQTPGLDDYVADYPELSESLRRLFEVQLLATTPEGQTGSGRPPGNPPGVTGSSLASAVPIEGPGERPSTFGRYQILQRLGEGGMGVVYLAHDRELDRRVALKVPHEEYERSPEAIARFQNEARAAASLDHPNVCRIYDVGQIDGRHYLAMAFIEGGPLSAFIDPTRPVDPGRAATWAMSLATALAEAHDRGIVHRDLKPSNVMVDRRGELIITDFGLARRLDVGGPELTRSGFLVGSPHYMAPEQVEGTRKSIGPACDIYSLGVILYELLTGRRPFRGSTLRIFAQILLQEPEPVSSLRPGIDAELEQICAKAMARSIEDRYPSMRSLADALAAWLARQGAATSDVCAGRADRAEDRVGPPWPGVSSALSLRTGRESSESPFPKREGEAPAEPRNGRKPARQEARPPEGAPAETASRPRSMIRLGAAHWGAWLLAGALGLIGTELWPATGRRSKPDDRNDRTTASAVLASAAQADDSQPPPPAPRLARNSVGMELRRIEPGEFRMGTPDGQGMPDESPPHTVRITRPFLLATHEVTWPQYSAVIPGDPRFLGDPDPVPMVSVDWYEAIGFCNALSRKEGLPPYYRLIGRGTETRVEIIQVDGPGYRLPTEAEWEYACRAGTMDPFPFGSDVSLLARYAWFNENSGKVVHPVGKKVSNAWGLYDMIGNAWEWCQDGYDRDYYQHSSKIDPRGPSGAELRVIRGGSVYDDICCRSAARQGHAPETKIPWLGFRVAAFPSDTLDRPQDPGPPKQRGGEGP